ncbi:hypothetical protein CC79DRAFT_1363830 [Sarocladium strictum]
MKSFICAAFAIGAGVAYAQNGITCDGSHFPNYDDCDAVIDYWGFRDGPNVITWNGEMGPEPSCTWYYWEGGNCRISACWTVTNQYAKDNGGPERLEEWGQNFARGYGGIRGLCESKRGGGRWPASANSPPDPTTARKPSAELFRKETVSLEEHDKWMAEREAKIKAREAEAAVEKTKLEARTTRDERRAAIMNAKRADDDDSYYINNSGLYLRKPDTYDVGPRGNNGVSTQYTVTESDTFTTSVSASIGGAFKMFTGEIGFSYEESHTFSISQGFTFTPNCEGNQQGQAFFYPFYDWYDVTFYPSATRAELWLPIPESDMFIKGEIVVECLV